MIHVITHVRHILREQILERLTNGITLGDDSLATLVSGAVSVSHECSGTDDAFQTLFQQLTRTHLVVSRGIHDNSLVEVVKSGSQLSSAVKRVLRHWSLALSDITDGVDSLADLLQDVVTVDLGQIEFGMANVNLGGREKHSRVLLENRTSSCQVIAQLRIFQFLLTLCCLLDQLVGVPAKLTHVGHEFILAGCVAQLVQIIFDDVKWLQQEMDVNHVGENQQPSDGRQKISCCANHVAAFQWAARVLAEFTRCSAHCQSSFSHLVDGGQHFLSNVRVLICDLLASFNEILRGLFDGSNESRCTLWFA